MRFQRLLIFALLAACSGEPPPDVDAEDPGVAGAATGDVSGAPASLPGGSGELRVPDVAFAVLGGGEATLTDFPGRILVVNFWGTWCAPCRREIPELVRLHAEYEARGVTVIGIAVDSGSEPAIRSFADEFGVNYPIWLTGGAIATGEFGAIGYPFTLLVDGDGLIRNQLLGPQDYETLEAEIERLRSETG